MEGSNDTTQKAAPKRSKKLTKTQRQIQRKTATEAKRRIIMKEHYAQEIKLCEENWKRCDEKWNQVFQNFQYEELLEDLLAMKQSIDLYLKSTTQQLVLILEAFDDLKEQTLTLRSVHIGALDQLLEIYDSRLLSLEKNYSSTLKRMQAEVAAENEVIREDGAKGNEYLAMLLSWQDERDEEREKKMKDFHSEAMLDCDSKHWTDMEKLEFELEESMEWLLEKLQSKLKTYLYTERGKLQEYEQLRTRDEWHLDVIFKQRFQLKKLNMEKRNLISKLKRHDEVSEVGTAVKTQKNPIFESYLKRKISLGRQIKDDNLSLRNLSVAANRSIEHLLGIWRNKERILILKGLCGKFELDEEKRTVPRLEFRRLESTLGKWKLEYFWEHCGKVELSTSVPRLMIKKLTDENESLKFSLKEIFTILSAAVLTVDWDCDLSGGFEVNLGK